MKNDIPNNLRSQKPVIDSSYVVRLVMNVWVRQTVVRYSLLWQICQFGAKKS
jgi:hypothetical protein